LWMICAPDPVLASYPRKKRVVFGQSDKVAQITEGIQNCRPDIKAGLCFGDCDNQGRSIQ